jgi:putative addiction module killer protein
MQGYEIRQTAHFRRWYVGLRDIHARSRIDAHLRHLAVGHLGDCRPVGDSVLELRIDCGPGYRVYLLQCGQSVILLLAGGDKDSQQRDIERAKILARKA